MEAAESAVRDEMECIAVVKETEKGGWLWCRVWQQQQGVAQQGVVRQEGRGSAQDGTRELVDLVCPLYLPLCLLCFPLSSCHRPAALHKAIEDLQALDDISEKQEVMGWGGGGLPLK